MDIRRHYFRIEYDNLFFCFAVVFSSVVSLFVQTVRIFISNTFSLDTLFIYVIFAIVFFKALPTFKHKVTIKELVLLFFITAAFLFSAFRADADLNMTGAVVILILTQCIPVYLGVKVIRASSKLNTYLRISTLIITLRVLANVYVFNAGELSENYSQYDGYLLLTAMALLFVPLVSEHKMRDFVMAAVILLVSLLTGARGPFLFCVVLLVVGLFIAESRKKRAAIYYTIIMFIAIIIAINMKEILLYISTHVGDSSSARTIDRLLNNEFFQDGARMQIYKTAIGYIKEHWFWGCGILNDRLIISRALPQMGDAIGCYPHNFFLEVGMQFGVIGGTLFSLILIIAIIKCYIRCPSSHEKLFLIALVGAGFLPLMVSASYLSYAMFYALIGFCNRTMKPIGGHPSYD